MAMFEPGRDVHRLHGGVCQVREFVDALDLSCHGNVVRIERCVGGIPILLRVQARAQLCREGLGRFVVILAWLPFGGQRAAAANGGPRIGRNHRYLARIFVSRGRIGGYLEDVKHSGDCLGFSGVEANKIAAKVWALSDHGVDHAWKPNVETEYSCSLHLGGYVEVRNQSGPAE